MDIHADYEAPRQVASRIVPNDGVNPNGVIHDSGHFSQARKYVVGILSAALHCPDHLFRDQIKNDAAIEQFVSNPRVQRLFLSVEEHKDADVPFTVVASIQPFTHMHHRVIYLLRSSPVELTTPSAWDEVTVGMLAAKTSLLLSLEHITQQIAVPIVTGDGSQTLGAGFIDTIRRFILSLQLSIGNEQGHPVLPLPMDETSNDQESAAVKARAVDSIMTVWSAQTNILLRADIDSVFGRTNVERDDGAEKEPALAPAADPGETERQAHEPSEAAHRTADTVSVADRTESAVGTIDTARTATDSFYDRLARGQTTDMRPQPRTIDDSSYSRLLGEPADFVRVTEPRGVGALLNAWQERLQDLQATATQLSSDPCRRFVRLAEKTRPAHALTHANMQRDVNKALEEAKSVTLLLQRLTMLANRIQTEPLEDLGHIFHICFHVVNIIWRYSPYVSNHSRLATILRELAHDTMRRLTCHIGAVSEMIAEPDDYIDRLTDVSRALTVFRNRFFRLRDEIASSNPEVPWRVPAHVLMPLEVFEDRVSDLKEVAQALSDFGTLDAAVLPVTIQASAALLCDVRTNVVESAQAIAQFGSDIFRVDPTFESKFDSAYFNFKQHLSDAELRVITVLVAAMDHHLQAGPHISPVPIVKILTALESLATRPAILMDIRVKVNAMFTAYVADSTKVTESLTKLHDRHSRTRGASLHVAPDALTSLPDQMRLLAMVHARVAGPLKAFVTLTPTLLEACESSSAIDMGKQHCAAVSATQTRILRHWRRAATELFADINMLVIKPAATLSGTTLTLSLKQELWAFMEDVSYLMRHKEEYPASTTSGPIIVETVAETFDRYPSMRMILVSAKALELRLAAAVGPLVGWAEILPLLGNDIAAVVSAFTGTETAVDQAVAVITGRESAACPFDWRCDPSDFTRMAAAVTAALDKLEADFNVLQSTQTLATTIRVFWQGTVSVHPVFEPEHVLAHPTDPAPLPCEEMLAKSSFADPKSVPETVYSAVTLPFLPAEPQWEAAEDLAGLTHMTQVTVQALRRQVADIGAQYDDYLTNVAHALGIAHTAVSFAEFAAQCRGMVATASAALVLSHLVALGRACESKTGLAVPVQMLTTRASEGDGVVFTPVLAGNGSIISALEGYVAELLQLPTALGQTYDAHVARGDTLPGPFKSDVPGVVGGNDAIAAAIGVFMSHCTRAVAVLDRHKASFTEFSASWLERVRQRITSTQSSGREISIDRPVALGAVRSTHPVTGLALPDPSVLGFSLDAATMTLEQELRGLPTTVRAGPVVVETGPAVMRLPATVARLVFESLSGMLENTQRWMENTLEFTREAMVRLDVFRHWHEMNTLTNSTVEPGPELLGVLGTSAEIKDVNAAVSRIIQSAKAVISVLLKHHVPVGSLSTVTGRAHLDWGRCVDSYASALPDINAYRAIIVDQMASRPAAIMEAVDQVHTVVMGLVQCPKNANALPVTENALESLEKCQEMIGVIKKDLADLNDRLAIAGQSPHESPNLESVESRIRDTIRTFEAIAQVRAEAQATTDLVLEGTEATVARLRHFIEVMESALEYSGTMKSGVRDVLDRFVKAHVTMLHVVIEVCQSSVAPHHWRMIVQDLGDTSLLQKLQREPLPSLGDAFNLNLHIETVHALVTRVIATANTERDSAAQLESVDREWGSLSATFLLHECRIDVETTQHVDLRELAAASAAKVLALSTGPILEHRAAATKWVGTFDKLSRVMDSLTSLTRTIRAVRYICRIAGGGIPSVPDYTAAMRRLVQLIAHISQQGSLLTLVSSELPDDPALIEEALHPALESVGRRLLSILFGESIPQRFDSTESVLYFAHHVTTLSGISDSVLTLEALISVEASDDPTFFIIPEQDPESVMVHTFLRSLAVTEGCIQLQQIILGIKSVEIDSDRKLVTSATTVDGVTIPLVGTPMPCSAVRTDSPSPIATALADLRLSLSEVIAQLIEAVVVTLVETICSRSWSASVQAMWAHICAVVPPAVLATGTAIGTDLVVMLPLLGASVAFNPGVIPGILQHLSTAGKELQARLVTLSAQSKRPHHIIVHNVSALLSGLDRIQTLSDTILKMCGAVAGSAVIPSVPRVVARCGPLTLPPSVAAEYVGGADLEALSALGVAAAKPAPAVARVDVDGSTRLVPLLEALSHPRLTLSTVARAAACGATLPEADVTDPELAAQLLLDAVRADTDNGPVPGHDLMTIRMATDPFKFYDADMTTTLLASVYSRAEGKDYLNVPPSSRPDAVTALPPALIRELDPAEPPLMAKPARALELVHGKSCASAAMVHLATVVEATHGSAAALSATLNPDLADRVVDVVSELIPDESPVDLAPFTDRIIQTVLVLTRSDTVSVVGPKFARDFIIDRTGPVLKKRVIPVHFKEYSAPSFKVEDAIYSFIGAIRAEQLDVIRAKQVATPHKVVLANNSLGLPAISITDGKSWRDLEIEVNLKIWTDSMLGLAPSFDSNTFRAAVTVTIDAFLAPVVAAASQLTSNDLSHKGLSDFLDVLTGFIAIVTDALGPANAVDVLDPSALRTVLCYALCWSLGLCGSGNTDWPRLIATLLTETFESTPAVTGMLTAGRGITDERKHAAMLAQWHPLFITEPSHAPQATVATVQDLPQAVGVLAAVLRAAREARLGAKAIAPLTTHRPVVFPPSLAPVETVLAQHACGLAPVPELVKTTNPCRSASTPPTVFAFIAQRPLIRALGDLFSPTDLQARVIKPAAAVSVHYVTTSLEDPALLSVLGGTVVLSGRAVGVASLNTLSLSAPCNETQPAPGVFPVIVPRAMIAHTMKTLLTAAAQETLAPKPALATQSAVLVAATLELCGPTPCALMVLRSVLSAVTASRAEDVDRLANLWISVASIFTRSDEVYAIAKERFLANKPSPAQSAGLVSAAAAQALLDAGIVLVPDLTGRVIRTSSQRMIKAVSLSEYLHGALSVVSQTDVPEYSSGTVIPVLIPVSGVPEPLKPKGRHRPKLTPTTANWADQALGALGAMFSVTHGPDDFVPAHAAALEWVASLSMLLATRPPLLSLSCAALSSASSPVTGTGSAFIETSCPTPLLIQLMAVALQSSTDEGRLVPVSLDGSNMANLAEAYCAALAVCVRHHKDVLLFLSVPDEADPAVLGSLSELVLFGYSETLFNDRPDCRAVLAKTLVRLRSATAIEDAPIVINQLIASTGRSIHIIAHGPAARPAPTLVLRDQTPAELADAVAAAMRTLAGARGDSHAYPARPTSSMSLWSALAAGRPSTPPVGGAVNKAAKPVPIGTRLEEHGRTVAALQGKPYAAAVAGAIPVLLTTASAKTTAIALVGAVLRVAPDSMLPAAFQTMIGLLTQRSIRIASRLTVLRRSGEHVQGLRNKVVSIESNLAEQASAIGQRVKSLAELETQLGSEFSQKTSLQKSLSSAQTTGSSLDDKAAGLRAKLEAPDSQLAAIATQLKAHVGHLLKAISGGDPMSCAPDRDTRLITAVSAMAMVLASASRLFASGRVTQDARVATLRRTLFGTARKLVDDIGSLEPGMLNLATTRTLMQRLREIMPSVDVTTVVDPAGRIEVDLPTLPTPFLDHVLRITVLHLCACRLREDTIVPGNEQLSTVVAAQKKNAGLIRNLEARIAASVVSVTRLQVEFISIDQGLQVERNAYKELIAQKDELTLQLNETESSAARWAGELQRLRGSARNCVGDAIIASVAIVVGSKEEGTLGPAVASLDDACVDHSDVQQALATEEEVGALFT
ncbi:Dynein heavy chain, N-terminal region 1 [Carpediemonas membranifera]|uniref:Dynein heavy chain, N-terminal region 1 n=1 Tax=Carpediemonas membranifera TaxID=201153 RepID=A0A8J6DYN3_9EUKA|nr:Dynein heavy chain, N-terminal region 1 [Carpediemonas membranifera]|eukprot:KAG9389588.1 Dynein heavy chain, N-terminal region 1 [Carpediemonas membranifera]